MKLRQRMSADQPAGSCSCARSEFFWGAGTCEEVHKIRGRSARSRTVPGRTQTRAWPRRTRREPGRAVRAFAEYPRFQRPAASAPNRATTRQGMPRTLDVGTTRRDHGRSPWLALAMASDDRRRLTVRSQRLIVCAAPLPANAPPCRPRTLCRSEALAERSVSQETDDVPRPRPQSARRTGAGRGGPSTSQRVRRACPARLKESALAGNR